MLPEIAAEALHFLTRRDLDKTCAVSKWLDALIAHFFDVYPLRPVLGVELLPYGNGSKPSVVFETDGFTTRYSFDSIDGALGDCHRTTTHLSPDHWTALIDAIRRGAVRRLTFECVDFSALDDDVFLVAVGFRDLQSLVVRRSVVPSRFVTDDFLRSSAAKGLCKLRVVDNKSYAPSRLSDDAVLDFFFRADLTPDGLGLDLTLNDTRVTDMFLSKFFERLQSRPVRHGILRFRDAPKQRGLSAYAQYQASDRRHLAAPIYRFPPIGNYDKSYYEVKIYERYDFMYVLIDEVLRAS